MSANSSAPYEVLHDTDDGGWWVSGPTQQPLIPRWACDPSREVAESICGALNRAYAAGAEVERARIYGDGKDSEKALARYARLVELSYSYEQFKKDVSKAIERNSARAEATGNQ